MIGRNRLSELCRKPEPVKKLGLVLVGIDRLAREPRPTERSSSYAILHALVQNVAGEFVLKRLDHELGVCSRLGLRHLGAVGVLFGCHAVCRCALSPGSAGHGEWLLLLSVFNSRAARRLLSHCAEHNMNISCMRNPNRSNCRGLDP